MGPELCLLEDQEVLLAADPRELFTRQGHSLMSKRGCLTSESAGQGRSTEAWKWTPHLSQADTICTLARQERIPAS